MMGEGKNHPLISIVVPIFNVEAYLNTCVDSLLDQDYDKYEIILVDDCSTDHSRKIARKYAKKYPEKCKLVEREKNGGLSAARNSGIQVMKGEWVTFVDSDDWVTRDYLSSLYKAAQHDHADVVMGNVYYAYSKQDYQLVTTFGTLKNGAGKQEIISICRSYACGRLFKSDLFLDSKMVFPEDIKRSEDIGTIIPLLTRANRISLVEKPLYFYYQRNTSLSNTNKNIDLSFYPKTLKRMFQLSQKGFEKELEFRAVHEMLYGMVFLMIESGKSFREFRRHVKEFQEQFPNWKQNPYLSQLPKEKQIFIFLAGKEKYGMLKGMVIARKILKKVGTRRNGIGTKGKLSVK
ncbi:MAG: glycosyltransferase family 2 protein [Lachnospiraceae bacterium]|nr:glycosyltransferase family 2 protein [Lachnospiraceae bacterium]